MAQDYNFYVHYITENTEKNKTKPTPQPSPTTPPTPNPAPTPFIPNGGDDVVFKPINVVSKGTNFAKVGVAFASAIISASIVDKTISLVGDIASGYGGNYELQHNRSNFKTITSTILNPLSLIEKNIQSEIQNYQEQAKRDQELLITGNGLVKGS